MTIDRPYNYYDQETTFKLDNGNVLQFKTPPQDFVDGKAWDYRNQDLINNNDLGSVMDPKECNSRTMKRLSQVQFRNTFKNTKTRSFQARYLYLKDKYTFLEEYIPANLFNQILQIVAHAKLQKKKILPANRLNLDTIEMILAIWQLELYTRNTVLNDSVLDDLNEYLDKNGPGIFIRGNNLTMKNVIIKENRIIQDLFACCVEKKEGKLFFKFPQRALSFYREYIKSFLQEWQKYVPEKIALKIDESNPKHTKILYRLIKNNYLIRNLRIKIVKTNLLNLSYHFNFNIEQPTIEKYATIFFDNIDAQFQIGDAKTVGLCILLRICQVENIDPPSTRIAEIVKDHNFIRLEKYQRRFSNILEIPQGESGSENLNYVENLMREISIRKVWLEKYKLFADYPELKEKYLNTIKSVKIIHKQLEEAQLSINENRVQERIDQYQNLLNRQEQEILSAFANPQKSFQSLQDKVEVFKDNLKHDFNKMVVYINKTLYNRTDYQDQYIAKLEQYYTKLKKLIDFKIAEIKSNIRIKAENIANQFDGWLEKQKQENQIILGSDYDDLKIREIEFKLSEFENQCVTQLNNTMTKIERTTIEHPEIKEQLIIKVEKTYQVLIEVLEKLKIENKNRIDETITALLNTEFDSPLEIKQTKIDQLKETEISRLLNASSDLLSL